MTKIVTEDPRVLAALVGGMGGSVVPARTFQFDLPRSAVKEVIPKINELGLRARNIGERIEDDPTRLGCNRSIVRIELYKSDDKQFSMPEW